MPFREKTAWLSLLAMFVAFVPYFTLAWLEPAGAQLPDLHRLGIFAATVTLQVVVLVAGHAYLRLTSPADAVLPPDERDREIERRAITSAYYVLIAGMIMVGFIMPFEARGWQIVNAALLVVVAAEAVHYAAIALRYRGQA